MPSNCCGPNRYDRLLRSKTITHLCVALELIDRLERALNEDHANNAPDVSMETEAAAQELFQYFNSKIPNTLSFFTPPAQSGGNPVVIDGFTFDSSGVVQDGNKVTHYGVYSYNECLCTKLPFQVKECLVNGKADGCPSLASLTNTSSVYNDDPDTNATALQYLEALCCVKNHYKEIKAYFEAEQDCCH